MWDPESLKGPRQSHYWVEKGTQLGSRGQGTLPRAGVSMKPLVSGLPGPGALSLETQAAGPQLPSAHLPLAFAEDPGCCRKPWPLSALTGGWGCCQRHIPGRNGPAWLCREGGENAA